jgi:hypothetical protein
MGWLNFLGMIASFAAGISAVAFAIAAARRFSAGGGGGAPALRELHDEIEQLHGELDQLRTSLDETKSRFAALDEVQNRLDFAERLLGQMKARDALPGPR